MKILNLDQFAEVTRRVNLGGVSYDVKEISVQDFCNNLVAAEAVDDDLAAKVVDGAELSGKEQAQAARKSVDLSVAAIRASVPTMPEKLIRAQSFSVLGALLQFIRGELDPAFLQGGAGAAAAPGAEGADPKKA